MLRKLRFAKGCVVLPAAVVCFAAGLNAATLYVGLNGMDRIQLGSSTGDVIGQFGPNDASAAASDAANGYIYVARPGDTQSVIERRDVFGGLVDSFVFGHGYITDLSFLDHDLLISEYNGGVYRMDFSSGPTVTQIFNTGNAGTGITTDGTYLYTTSGLFSPFIRKWTPAGEAVAGGDIDTGLLDALGIAFDSSNGSFWVGGADVLTNVDASGAILSTRNISGTLSGLEVGVDVQQGPPPGVPEPSTMVLMGAGFAALLVMRVRGRGARVVGVLAGAAVIGTQANAAVNVSALNVSAASPQPVGTLVTFSANASDTSAGALQYRFRVRPAGGTYGMVIDYGPANSFVWTASSAEGSYDVEVSVKNASTGSTASMSIPYSFTSRVTGSSPVVSQTNHPLVARYSAPPCAAGASMRVRFKRPSDALWSSTDAKPCDGSTTMNFYVAGMYAASTYTLRNDVIAGPRITTSSDLTFTTGMPATTFPGSTVIAPPQSPTSVGERVLLFAPLRAGAGVAGQFATDLNGSLLWYYTPAISYITRPVPGGTMIGVYGLTTDLNNSGFREFDLVGMTVKQTNVVRLNEQLTARGMHPITAVHHEARKLANGNYMMLGMSERRTDAQGGVMQDILGDMVLILDNNLQLIWAWDEFDHFDVSQPPVLGERCAQGQGGCVVLQLNGDASAVDWTHTNSAALTPDGNIIISVRHHDAVYKINYANGTGDGRVLWKLGRSGDFTFIGGDPVWPWFSHQHDAEYESSDTISLFDNGNTREFNGLPTNSRGQVIRLDESAKTATVLLNADLGSLSRALGSAQRLANGNYHFDSGYISATNTDNDEVNSSGSFVYQLRTPNLQTYRTFRLRDLYSARY